MKKKSLIVIAIILLCGNLQKVSAQNYSNNMFSVTPIIQTSNLWSSDFMAPILSYPIGLLCGQRDIGYNIDFITLKNNGKKIAIDDGNFFHFKAVDMFDNINAGLRFGWQNINSPIGVFVEGIYRYNQFRAKFPDENSYVYNRIQTIIPGVLIQIQPRLISYTHVLYPIIRGGVKYEYNFAYKGNFNNNLDQLNNGFVSTYAIGFGAGKYQWLLSCDVQHYNMFNQSFTPDKGITYPYKDVTSSRLHFYISYTVQLN